MSLRSYQVRAIDELRGAYSSGKRAPCLVLPTGAGKTVVAAEIIRSAVALGRRALFAVHRSELLDQSVSKLEQAGVTDLRVIQGSRDSGSPAAPVAVASIQTITRWAGRMPPADMVIVDECHHTVASTWASVVAAYPSAYLLGLTATPQRGDGKPLGDIFDALVVGSTVRELTDLGHLVPCRVWAPMAALESSELALSPLASYQQHGDGHRAVIFCATVDHARTVADEFTAAGFPCGVVSGVAKDRAETLARFRAGELRAVATVYVLAEGWDDPGAAVCILARKPQHAGTFLQMVGRVLRPSPGKEHAMLIDLCGSVHEHGTPDAEREFSLDGDGIRQSSREPIRQCQTCGFCFAAGGGPACPSCGATLPARPTAMPRAIGVGLSELGTVAPVRHFTREIVSKFNGICRSCRSMVSVGDRILWTKGLKPRHVVCPSVAP